MKDVKGWTALAIFLISCAIIGVNGFLLKRLNLTVVVMLGLSIVIVAILNMQHTKSDSGTPEKQ